MKKSLSLLVAMCVILSSLTMAAATEPVVSAETIDMEQVSAEIRDYLDQHPSFGVITKPFEVQTITIPLSVGGTVQMTIRNERVSPSTKGSVTWTDFDSGDYILYFDANVLNIADFEHTVDYSLTRMEALGCAYIDFKDTDISVIPVQFVNVAAQDAMITENDTLAAKARAYFTLTTNLAGFEPTMNFYSYIDMSNAGGTEEGIAVKVNSYWSLM